MADWNTPILTTDYDDVISILNEKILHAAKMDFTSDTNIPTGAIRYNTTTNLLERYNGTSWVSIHPGVQPGAIVPLAHAGAADEGFLICNGAAISRTTYAPLFTKIGTLWGAGDGSTTFNVPLFDGYSLIGVKSSEADINTVGKKTGSFNHSHSTPNHTHNVPAHEHTVPAHTHTVKAHYHDSRASGADIAIGVSGAHSHLIRYADSTAGGTNRRNPRDAGESGDGWISTATDGNHSHANSTFTGRVGKVSGGVDGDSSQATEASTAIATTGGAIIAIASSGSGTSGQANGPVAAVQFQIKY